MPYAIGDRKICSTCRADLPLTAFDKNRAAKDGLANQCHECLKESRRKWREGHPREHRGRHVKNRYRIGLDEYEALASVVGGKCPICGEPPTAPLKTLDLDHDHVTGRVRGFLCRGCNLALGGARDNPDILRALAEYVEQHRAIPIEQRMAPEIPTFYAKGESHPLSKLTEDHVREIRALGASGIKQADIAARFGITQAMVSMIIRRRSWKHVPEE
jgi:hypothetical protein